MARIDENVKIMMLKGEQGASIKSIDKTGIDGLVDTYTVALTNGETYDFYVTNGSKGDKGDKGDSGTTISVPVNGLFNLGVDGDGNLWCYYSDDTNPPTFEYDSKTGNLYYITEG